MKKIILALALFSSIVAQAQTINFETVKDDPSVNNWLSVNLDIFGMEIPGSSLDAAIENLSFNYGVWGHVEPNLPVGLQYSFQRSWFVLGAIGNKKTPNHSDYQLGAYFFLRDNTKTKNMNVGLKSTSRDVGDTRYTTNTFIAVDGKKRKQFGVRAGLMFKASGLSVDTEKPTPSGITNTRYSSTGFYAGLLNRSTTNLVLNTDKYGLVSSASKASHVYLDAIVAFSNSFTDVENGDIDVTSEMKTHLSGFPIGARLGYQVYQMEQRNVTGKMFGISGRCEAGYRPFYGPYLSASFGLTIIKAQR